MSNYTKATNFATKDALTTGNPLKTLSGTELDDEFNALSVASATKANANNAALTGVPVAPTASQGTSTTQVATTAFVAPTTTLASDALPKVGGTMTGDTLHGDNVKAKFGTAGDLEIYHDGNHSRIKDVGTGNLSISASVRIGLDASNGDNMAAFNEDGSVQLFHNGSERIATTSTGVDVTGTVTADGLAVAASADSDSITTITSSATANNTQLRLGTNGNDAVISGSGGSAGGLKFKVYGSEKMAITSAGNVGIGSSSPEYQLDLDSGTTVSERVRLARGSDDTTQFITLGWDNISSHRTSATLAQSQTSLKFKQVGSDGSRTNMIIDPSGNVGIGPETPARKLHISAPAGAEADIHLTNAATGHTNAEGTTITTSGLNTLILNRAAGYMAFSNGGTERMRIDSSGNVGLGVVPAAWNTGFTALQIGENAALYNEFDVATGLVQNAYKKLGADWAYTSTNEASWYEQYNGTHLFKVAPSGAADAAISWTNAMTIKNDGQWTIGTFSASGGTKGVEYDNTSLNISAATTSEQNVLRFFNPNVEVGSIKISGSSTSYNTSSDHRLKTDVQPMTGATATFMQLNPVNFEWIADGTRVDGFLAHELGEVIPAAATGTHNGMMDEEYEVTPAVVDDEGVETTPAVMATRSVPDYQGIDQSKIVPLLVATLQEALARISALEA